MHPAYEGLSAMPFYDEFDLSTVDVLLISQYVYARFGFHFQWNRARDLAHHYNWNGHSMRRCPAQHLYISINGILFAFFNSNLNDVPDPQSSACT